jgi:hypothetical protein
MTRNLRFSTTVPWPQRGHLSCVIKTRQHPCRRLGYIWKIPICRPFSLETLWVFPNYVNIIYCRGTDANYVAKKCVQSVAGFIAPSPPLSRGTSPGLGRRSQVPSWSVGFCHLFDPWWPHCAPKAPKMGMRNTYQMWCQCVVKNTGLGWLTNPQFHKMCENIAS